MESRCGKLLGRYEIVAEVGRGGMGVVYKARDPKIDRFVAIKTISLHGQAPDERRQFRERFFVEARAAGRLTHPSIVTIFDVGEEPESSNPYIVMEYVEGETLRDWLSGGSRRLPIPEAMRMVQDLAEALDYAHAQGVVHRDIKPANILVTKDGHAKIGDFGIAQLDFSQITAPGRPLGTPAYMSPEQLEGQTVDGRSDLFSLGTILYWLVTGFNPFQGSSATTVSFKVANRDPLPASALAPELPAGLDGVIARALAKNPDERYQSGMDFARGLQALRQKSEKASNLDEGALWFSEPEGRRTWLNPITKIEGRLGGAASIDSSKTPVSPAARQSQRSPFFPSFSSSIFSSRRLLAGLGISFLLAAMGLGFLARRHSGMPAVQQATVMAEATSTSTADPPKQMSAVQRLLAESAAQAGEEQANTPAAGSVETNARHSASESRVSESKPRTSRTRPVAGRIVAATRQPEVSGAVSSATTAAEPASGTAAGAVADSNLEIRIENRFADATLSVWIDNRLAYEHPLRDGRKKRLILLGGGAKQTITIPVAAGQHDLRIGVQSAAEQYDESKTVAGEFLKNGEKILSINFEKRSKAMRVSLQ